jgi:hypothetical protein
MHKVILLGLFLTSSPALSQAGPVGNGRYIIVHSPHIQRDTVLLDTVTGKTWVMVTITGREGEPVVWDPMYRLDVPTEAADLNKYNPPKQNVK